MKKSQDHAARAICLECAGANGEHRRGCDMPEIAALRGPDWKQLAARLAEALEYAHRVWMLREGHECDSVCKVRDALAHHAAATKETP